MSFSRPCFSYLALALALVCVAGCGESNRASGLTTPVMRPAPSATAEQARDDAAQRRIAYVTQYPQWQADTRQRPKLSTPSLPPKAQNVKVALLVPLTGNSAPLGEAMVKAAQMAVFDIGVNNFELLPRDTQGTPQGAAAAAREALASGARLLIGPVFAAEVSAAKPVAQKAGVSMLALSTDVSLAQSGIYVLGFAPAPQVERIVSYAFERGKTRFAMIVPMGPYGQIVSDTFRRAVRHLGGQIVIERPVGDTGPIVAAQDEIDALFLPVGGAQLKSILTNLVQAGLDVQRVKLLGTGLWDEPHIVQEMPALSGAWFPAAELSSRAAFLKAFEETYGAAPLRLATLAYDATALAAVLTHHGLALTQSTLTMQTGFAGVDGLFRLQQNGAIERGLAVMEISKPENIVINPAPIQFTPQDEHTM